MQEISEDEELIELPRSKKKERLAQKLEVIRKRDRISQIVFSKEVREYFGEEFFGKEQEEFEKRVARSFLEEELAYILRCQEKQRENTDLYVLVNEYSKETKEMLEYFAKEYKVVHILSKNMKYYTRWIERLEEKDITNLIYSRNYRKSLAKADLVINVDFTKEELKKFKLNREAIILHLMENNPELDQFFNGIFITSFCTDLERQNSLLEQFSPEEIYVAHLEENLNLEEVWQKIKKDDVNVRYLKGINGRIDEKEYKSLLKS